MRSGNICPVCGSDEFVVDRSPIEIGAEIEARKAFVIRNLGRLPEGLEAVDLTEFMHGNPARLLSCRSCGMLVREEENRSHYADDLCDFDVLRELYARNLRSYECRQSFYRPLLRDRAEVLEVGSHLGAFLQTAEQWGWRPTGLDIGESTSQFARKQGVTVRRQTINEYSPRLRRPEGIFIWNCFEQLDDPAATLRRSWEMLDRHGLLLLRVPNAAFYLQKREHTRSLRTLGYNNLLGFPYLHGFTLSQLNQMLSANGFRAIAAHPSSLLALPYPDISGQVKREWSRIEKHGGPWLEVVSRKATN